MQLAPTLALPTPDDLATYDQTFASRNIGGYVDGNTAREVFVASQLPNDVLSAIWRLSDMDGDSQLSHLEFRIGMPDRARTPGQQIPDRSATHTFEPCLDSDAHGDADVSAPRACASAAAASGPERSRWTATDGAATDAANGSADASAEGNPAANGRAG